MSDDTRSWPQDLLAERAILGQAMLDPDVVPEVRGIVDGAHFYRPARSSLFALFCAMLDAGEPVDMVSVIERVSRDPSPFGGVVYVSELVDSVASTRNYAHYARIVRDKYVLRCVLEQVARLKSRCLGDPGDADALIAGAVAALESARAIGTVRAGVSIADASDGLLDQITDVYYGRAASSLLTGFPALDRVISLHGGDLLVVAARPGTGKTAFALSCARYWAHRYQADGINKQVLVYSLEMPATQLVGRLVADIGSIPGEAFRQRPMSHTEYQQFMVAHEEVRELPITIFDASGMTIQAIRSQAAAAHRETPVGVVLIDYCQLVRNDDKGLSTVERIGAASKGSKALAKDLGVPVMLLTQISREGAKRAKLTMNDLKGSGEQEEDADQIILMSRPGQTDDEVPEGRVMMDVAKNRHGATGTAELWFDMRFSRFECAR